MNDVAERLSGTGRERAAWPTEVIEQEMSSPCTAS